MWLELLLVFVIGGILFYRWGTEYDDHFKKRNIPHDKPVFLLGSARDVMMGRKSALQVMCEFHQKFSGSAYGAFDNRKPVLMIREPKMVKHILIDAFNHFVNRNNCIPVNEASLFTNSIFMMENLKWNEMRKTLNPVFRGNKIEQMLGLMLKTVHENMSDFRDQHKNANAGGFEVDVKDLTMRLTNDIIASVAFGVEVNSLRDKENEFYMQSKRAICFTPFQHMKIFFMMLFPKIAEFFKMDFLGRKSSDYFFHLVMDAMKHREEENIQRPDMIDLLMEGRGRWSDIEIAAQCLIFLFAGFETTSGAMGFAGHELMEYPEVQQKLFEEIQEVDKQLQGKPLTHEILQKMTYMDMVVSEVLRKWPVAMVSDRTCTSDYDYVSPISGDRISIKKDELVRIPTCALQRDAKYFESPEKLKPERFSAENKSKIETGTYLPFGLGARNCIGKRFALLEIKAFLFYVLRDYRLEASSKTCLPMELDMTSMHLQPKTGFWLQFKPRKH
ncbi:probable cytochrome P450 9f2 [Stomoxys calcitrans]|uniref:probable cytochrome P450 9f2 n=1 Tax=Stomoxys calcitrans TaxID=35570 RepID=UPI0027E2A0B3|nr:probable cytochrome P450 9f2 [Stomoxys calcitrans]